MEVVGVWNPPNDFDGGNEGRSKSGLTPILAEKAQPMSIWTRWLKVHSFFSRGDARRPSRGKPAGKRSSRKPTVEQLEDRTMPSFGLTALHLGSSTGATDYDYTAANKVVPVGTVDA